MNPRDRLIVALDVDTEEKAVALAERLKDDVRFFKIGFELFSACGPSVVKRIRAMGCGIFLDLKFHDIPNTVSRAAGAVTRLGVRMFNVHASGGYEMMEAAARAAAAEAKKLGIERPKVIAVTVLTSMDENGLKKIGVDVNMKIQVMRLAALAKKAGLDGVVASPVEARLIRDELGSDFLIVTPGVRPSWAGADDQKRVATPKDAIRDGADLIVVGRPVTEAKDPAQAAQDILKEIGS